MKVYRLSHALFDTMVPALLIGFGARSDAWWSWLLTIAGSLWLGTVPGRWWRKGVDEADADWVRHVEAGVSAQRQVRAIRETARWN